MAIDEESRHRLFIKLRSVLGEEEATTLIEYLPPVGWADVATRNDLQQLEQRMGLRFDTLRAEMRAEMHEGFATQSRAMVRTFLLAYVASILSVAGFAFGAARLA